MKAEIKVIERIENLEEITELAVNAIQELSKSIDQLKTDLDDLVLQHEIEAQDADGLGGK